ncbi:regulatory LuxR family protein [Salana multivorans]|uniref:Regulatory LuxR family protein n=1 Tax=Salana multivorans TaxID=120377 RepID=A0A3N2D959_9MICO|nr:LuxR C-terminal-related transcriptional regulator [Salana multivorans]ROR96310.1 regulatory LuxR family protein [Salana multivorans]
MRRILAAVGRAREHPLQAISLTPVVTRTHLELVDSDLVDSLTPVAVDGDGTARTTYELPPDLRRSIERTGSPFTERETRDIHRAFARALSQEISDPEVGLALRHARYGEDWDTMHALWVRHGLGLVTRSAEIATWAFTDLPSEATKKFPFLSLATAIFDRTLAEFDAPDRRATIQTVARRASTAIHALWSNRSGAVTLHLLVGQIIDERINGSLKKAAQLGARVAAEIEKQTERGTLTDHGLLAWCEFQVGMTQLLQGDTSLSRTTTRRAYTAALSGGIDAEYIVVNAASQLAVIHALSGELNDAEAWADRAEQHQCHPWFDPLVRLPARIAREMVSVERLQPSPTTLAAESDSLRGTEMWPFVARTLARRKIYNGNATGALLDLYRWRSNSPNHERFENERLLIGPEVEALVSIGDPHDATRSAEAFFARHQAQPEDTPGASLPYARALHLSGDSRRARRIAAKIARSKSPHPLIDVIEARLLLADIERSARSSATHVPLGHLNEAIDHLGLTRLYATVSEDLLSTLGRGPNGVLDAALRHMEATGRLFPPAVQRPALTPRELVVLRHLAEGHPLSDIARDLGLSVNTIKTQASSLYRKLGASTRRQAVDAAAREGFL